MSDFVPEGWLLSEAEELYSRMRVPQVYDRNLVDQSGKYPVLDQSENGCVGYLNSKPEFECSPSSPLTTFANHTCAVRQMTRSFGVIQNVFPLKAKAHVSQEFLFQILKGAIPQNGYKGHYPDLREKLFLTPPLPEQQKIATILSSVDDVIEKTHAQIDKLKDLKTGMMQELLTKGIGHTEFKDSPVGPIPAVWEVKCLPEIATYQNGKAFPSSDYLSSDKDGCYLVKPVNLDPDGRVNWNYKSTTKLSRTYWKSAENYRVGPHEILMNLTAQSLDDNFLGRVCITREGDKCILNQRIARIAANEDEVLQKYLFWALQGSFFRSHVERITQGSKVQHLYNSNLDEALIAFPTSILEQKKICALLNSLESAIYGKSQKLAKLKSTKKALMQDLLTGKVRVNITDKESAVV